MANINWVKLSTDLFDNRKIKYIRKLDHGNDIVLIWVMLLTLAGKCNDDGAVYLTQDIPYTADMLSNELGYDLSIVESALHTLSELGMILTDGGISVAGWEEHQNVDGMNKVREQNRLRQQKHRNDKAAAIDAPDDTQDSDSSVCSYLSRDSNVTVTRDKNVTSRDSNVTVTRDSNVTSRDSHATDKNRIDKNRIDKNIYKGESPKQSRHKYGEYKNVLLTDDDLQKLKTEFPNDWQDRIENLSAYMASKGKSYKNHLATIRNWAKRDKTRGQPIEDGCMGVTFEL